MLFDSGSDAEMLKLGRDKQGGVQSGKESGPHAGRFFMAPRGALVDQW